MIDDLIGQVIWAFISAREDIALAEQAVARGRLGGVWLLPTEMRSAQETATLVNRLQLASPTPLLVGVDAEAGLGLVMGTATQLPTTMALGATRDPALVREAAVVTAVEAGACGINCIAAPVLDVNVNPLNPIINVRSFGSDPHMVAELGQAFLSALAELDLPGRTVLPIAKHFPGHGDTTRDSHLQLDTVRADRDRLEAVELAPFRAAIASGVPLLMTAHVAYPALDPSGDPATVSRPILTDLLRNELDFRGAVVTDCMNMHAVSKAYSPEDGAVRAVLAGCDLIMTDRWEAVYDGLRRAVLDERLPVARLEEAAGRVAETKRTIFGDALGRPHPIDPQAAQWSVGTPAHVAAADEIAAATITQVSGQLVPPSPRPLILATRMARHFGPPVELQLRNALDAVGWAEAEILMLDPSPEPREEARAIEAARTAGWVALLHFNRVESFDPDAVLVSDELVGTARALVQTGADVTVVSMGTPYALPRFANATATVAAYSTCDASLRATLRVLRGEEQASGTLPVELRPASLVS